MRTCEGDDLCTSSGRPRRGWFVGRTELRRLSRCSRGATCKHDEAVKLQLDNPSSSTNQDSTRIDDLIVGSSVEIRFARSSHLVAREITLGRDRTNICIAGKGPE